MRFLFSKMHAQYSLLPEDCLQGDRLVVLIKNSLASEKLPDHSFFLTCTDNFLQHCVYVPDMHRSFKQKMSLQLAQMLQANTIAYKASSSSWAEAKEALNAIPIFMTAELQKPYKTYTDEEFVSLQDSADYSNYRLVSNALAITHYCYQTTELREALKLPTRPKVGQVISHINITASDTNKKVGSAPIQPLPKQVVEDVQAAYLRIFEMLSNLLQAEDKEHLQLLAQRLTAQPWVLVQNKRFVTPDELCFDIDEEYEHAESRLVLLQHSVTLCRIVMC